MGGVAGTGRTAGWPPRATPIWVIGEAAPVACVTEDGQMVYFGPLAPLPPEDAPPTLRDLALSPDGELMKRRRGRAGIPDADLRLVARKEWRL